MEKTALEKAQEHLRGPYNAELEELIDSGFYVDARLDATAAITIFTVAQSAALSPGCPPPIAEGCRAICAEIEKAFYGHPAIRLALSLGWNRRSNGSANNGR